MRHYFISFLLLALIMLSFPAFSQTENPAAQDTSLLGLPGDNLDLYAVMELFQKSKTIEDFEKSLNTEKTGINNLDLNLDGKVDFIKVVTKKNGDDFTFILQDDVSKTETQDVAVILVSKDKNKKVTLQVVGDPELYGKNYIVEPKAAAAPAATANPAYTGNDPITVPAPKSTTTVVIESAPIVQYVYSPVYVPYVPPYYYGYHPPYFAAFTVMAVGIYRHNNYYYHGGGYGYGYRGNTVVIHNTYNYNSYHGSRNTSNTVNRNINSGNYNRNNVSTRPGGGGSGTTRPSTQPSTRPAGGSSGSARPSTQPSTRPAGGSSGSARPSTQPSTRPSGGSNATARPSQPSTRETGGAGSTNRQSMSNKQPSTNTNAGNRSSSGGRGGGGGSHGGGRGGGGRR